MKEREGPQILKLHRYGPNPRARSDRQLRSEQRLASGSRRDPIGLRDPHLKGFGSLLSQCELIHKLKPRTDPDFHEANPILLERLRSTRSPRNEAVRQRPEVAWNLQLRKRSTAGSADPAIPNRFADLYGA